MAGYLDGEPAVYLVELMVGKLDFVEGPCSVWQMVEYLVGIMVAKLAF